MSLTSICRRAYEYMTCPMSNGNAIALVTGIAVLALLVWMVD